MLTAPRSGPRAEARFLEASAMPGEAEGCWRALFEGATNGIMLLDDEGRILLVNPACARLHGHGHPSEMKGLAWTGLRGDLVMPGIEARVRLLPADETITLELDHRRRDGSVVPLRADVRRVEVEQGGGMLVFLTDLTFQRAAATEVRRQEARLLLALEVAEMVTWELEVATGILRYSTNLADLAGAEDVTRYLTLDRFTEAVHPEDRERTRHAIARTMTTGCPFDCEYRVQLPDGSWHWLAGRGRAVAGPDGRWDHVLGVSQDITARKERESYFRSLVENSPDGLMVVDAATLQIGAANPAAVRMFGAVGESELLAYTPYRLSPARQPGGKESVAAARLHVEAAVREGFHSFEWTHARLDGTEFQAHVQLVRVEQHGRCLLQATVRDVTAQKAAEEALRRSEEKHRIVADNTFDWEFWIGPDGRYIYTSPSCERITGIPPAAFAADPGLFHRLIHPEDRDRHEFHHAHASQGGIEPEQEYRIVRPDGEVRWIGHVCGPIHDESGRFLGVRGSNRDITARKRAEEELVSIHRQRERLLLFNEALMASIPIPVFYKDREGRYLGCSRRFSELMGVQASELVGRTVQELWPSEQARIYHEKDLELMRNPAAQSYEYRVTDKDGVERDVIFAKNVFYDENDQPAGIIGAFLDISERKRAEGELVAEAARRRILIESSRDGIVVLDRDGGVFEANRRFAEMLGYTAEEVRRLHVWDWDRAWPRGRVVAAIRELGPEGMNFETTHWRKDGSHFEVELSNSLAEVGGQRLVFCVCHDVTERKRAMEALAMREEIFSNIVGQAMDAIAVVDAEDGRFVEFNTSAHEGLGYTREEFSGFGVGNIQAEQNAEQIRAQIEQIQRAGHATFETRHRHKDGSERDVRVSVRPLRLRDRNLLASVWTDITDRKRAEARARRDNRRTEFLLELHRRAAQMQDSELYDHVLGRAVELTDSTQGVIHLVTEDQRMLGQTVWWEPGVWNGVRRPLGGQLAQEPGAWQGCIQGRCPILRNSVEGAESGLRPFPWHPGESGRYMGVPVVDHERVRLVLGVGGRTEAYAEDDVVQLQVVANELHKILLQRAVQHRLRQLSSAVEQSPVSVVITNIDGLIEYTNPKFTQVTGYSAEEVRGQNPRVLKSGTMEEPYYRDLWRTVLAGRSWHGEFHNRRKNGELFWESASISPIVDPAGKLSHFVAVKEDITERKRLESELRQAQKLEAVGQLAGGVAHDFNNILAAIMMHLGLAQMNPELDAETRETLKEIELESGRAASLTRQLLMFSRRSVLAIKPQDLNEIIANLLKMLTRLIGENIKLRFEGGCLLPSVEADAGMLEQVLMNLVVNARDAMPRGGCITIATSVVEFGDDARMAHPQRVPGRMVGLSVSDTGTGMDEATLKRIFEPFFTTKEAGRGTGLGLATVHGIVAQHKGWVEVESRVGEGSTFHVYLPAMSAAPASAETVVEPAPLQRGRETVLVVEDETRLRELVARTLRGLGYRVHEAGNGREAMRLWQDHGPGIDLLLTDMVMPEGLTGLELSERLVALKPDLKVIITSGYSAEIVHAGLPAKSGVTYLPKPFLDRRLAEVVRASLDRGH